MLVKISHKKFVTSSSQTEYGINAAQPRSSVTLAAAESINSIILIARTVMAGSGLRERFWFKAATAGVDADNVTFKESVGTTPHHLMYGEKRDVFDLHAFGCRAWVYLLGAEPGST
jgi:hypothetical protein